MFQLKGILRYPTFLAALEINNLRVFNTPKYSDSPRLHHFLPRYEGNCGRHFVCTHCVQELLLSILDASGSVFGHAKISRPIPLGLLPQGNHQQTGQSIHRRSVQHGVAAIATKQRFLTNTLVRFGGAKMKDGKLLFPFYIDGTIDNPVFSKGSKGEKVK